MNGAGPPEQYGVLADQQIFKQGRYPTMCQSNKVHISHPVSLIGSISYCFSVFIWHRRKLRAELRCGTVKERRHVRGDYIRPSVRVILLAIVPSDEFS
jgi:hypothetical protein